LIFVVVSCLLDLSLPTSGGGRFKVVCVEPTECFSPLPTPPKQQPQPRTAALTASLSQLEVAADYTEAQAAHVAEVAALNAAIAADREALTRIAEDTKGWRFFWGGGRWGGVGECL
jgi:hypothetical protein